MRRYFFFILCITVSLFMIRCTGSDIAGGGTIETTNGIIGAIYNTDNTPAPSSIVRLYPENYNPVSDVLTEHAFTDTTDENGKFRFRQVSSGRYTLLARNSNASKSLIVNDISVTGDSITTLDPEILKSSSSIVADLSGTVPFDSGTYVYIPGTDIFTFVMNNKEVFLNNVPPGRFSDVILVTLDGEKRNILREEVAINSGDTLLITQPLWKYSREVILNTSSTGAAVSEDITDFPVLIRLDNSFFDFSLARTDGGDMVFTDRNNKSLPHEIERWDAITGFAEIWVRVDTVYGNDSTQSIMMYWGNSDHTDASERTAVFDTALGYQGVWHLGEITDGTVPDATVNGYHGITPDSARPESAEGVVGNCLEFDGTNDFITIPNSADGKLDFSEDENFTVSAWVNISVFDNVSHCVVSKGFEQYYLRSTYVDEGAVGTEPQWEFVEFSENNKWQTLTSPASGGEWVMLTGVCRGAQQFLYCNGVVVDSSIYTWPGIQEVRNINNDLFIGRFAEEVTLPPVGAIVTGYNHFKGSIDEVRIMSKAHNRDWIKLCYMNQQRNDRLVVFR